MTRPIARRRVTVMTSGHLSTCPRMLKAADALHADGFDVRVIATRHEPWATVTDDDVRTRRNWPLSVVDYRRAHGLTYWRTGLRQRAARSTAGLLGPARLPEWIVPRAFSRTHSELVRAASDVAADFIYGGTTGALAAVAEAARRQGVPYAVDLEDLHSAETDGPDAAFVDELAARVEQLVLPRASFTTTSSEPIGHEYERRYGVRPTVIHNAFPLPSRPPDFTRPPGAPLRVYWFSQTIGPGRGLEDAIAALGRTNSAAELTVRGRAKPGYFEMLQDVARRCAPSIALIQLPPAPPDAMIDLARGYDVGLALEQLTPENHRLALSNKAFTYILAGAAIAMTDTPGQHGRGTDLGCGAALVPPGDIDALTAVFSAWIQDPAALDRSRRAAWDGAVRRWHWEHDDERGRLCRLVRNALQ
jgi:glycosyltransferase involved in cell wall biosynthesis